MPLRFLLDTDIASYAINNRFPKVREQMKRVPFLDIAVSVITEAELRFGLARRPSGSRVEFAVEDFLHHAEILPWDSRAAKRYATLRTNQEREGSLLGAMDLMIAAHALAVGCTLVTHDQGFQKVKGLRLADWTR
ncbi:MAG TPA: type II toxin-antitoxin system VapC family toxin [Terriglobales bacterium]|jgi:tRNA(fMet)-specific endonuclease VapC|nr:type II toxin-antitoxin system VapC family toxin [Terriglobales bacterium]